jgi:septal ring factor EnvC (AmiA/AmiB activator)
MFGKNGGRSLVVRQRTSALHTALLIAGVLIGVFALYVVYELGRYNAGYDRQTVAQQRTGLEVQIEHLEKDNREMRTRLAELDTIRVGRAREQAEVARTMGDLQAQVARQSQELAFYRGVVAQGATTVGVKIEQLRITAGQRPATYIVHMSLVRSGRADAPATGSVQLSLDGTAAEGARTLDLAALTAGRQRELRYNFHYLESFDQELTVPLSFKPERLNVEVSSGRREVAPLSQTFLWSVEASP